MSIIKKLSKIIDILLTDDTPEEWKEGNQAYYDGASVDMCPYPAKTGCNATLSKRHKWLKGYHGKR